MLTSIQNEASDGASGVLSVARITTGRPGRPWFAIAEDQLCSLLQVGFSVPHIAHLLGTSVWTIRRRMEEFGLSVSDFCSSISDNDLDGIVIEVLTHFPNSGYRMMAGHLHEKTWDSCTATANSRKSPPCCSCLYSCQMECNSSTMHLQCYISACSLAC